MCVCAETDGATDMWMNPDFEHMKSRQYHRCIGPKATALLFSRQVFIGISECTAAVFTP